MQYRIKRTKAAPLGPMHAITGGPPPAVHYALVVDATGSVTGWTSDVLSAGTFDEGTAAKVRANYQGRANAGTLAFEKLAGPKAAAEKVEVPAPPAVVKTLAPATPSVAPPVPAASPTPAPPPRQPEPEKISGRKATK